MNGSDYAGLPSSSLWPCPILTIVDGKYKRKGFIRDLLGCNDLRIDGTGGVPLAQMDSASELPLSMGKHSINGQKMTLKVNFG